jgi:hypothetical protein
MAKGKTELASTGHKGTLKQVAALVDHHMTLFFGGQKNVPTPYIKGPPGIGKTDMIHQLAQKHEALFKDVPLIIYDTVDMRGIPYVDPVTKVTRWALPGEFPSDGKGILFFDEFTQAFQSLQNSASRIILSRQLGEWRVPDGWFTVLASNREGDKAATHKMASFLNNRVSHYEIDPNLEEWRDWAMKAGIHEKVIAFLSFRPNLLHDFNPDFPAFPSPRSWAFMSALLKDIDDKNVLPIAAATVGDGPAGEFFTFWKATANLPEFDDIIKRPGSTPIPTGPAPLYAVSVMVAQRMNEKNSAKAWEYVTRLPEEYSFLALYLGMSRTDHRTVMNNGTINAWITKHPHLLQAGR